MSSITPQLSHGVDELLRLKRDYLIPCVYHFYKRPPRIVAGEGCYLFDDEGKPYLDCYTGVTVMSAGHCNPEIIEPAIEQIRQLQHTTSIYLSEPMLRLAEALATIAPGELRKSFFCASGSEAVEGALLLASLHTGRTGVIAMQGGLHGRTRWAMNATGLDMWRTDPAPLGDVHHVPFDDIEALAACLAHNRGRIAAVIAEPIQGNGGIRAPGDDYWPRVRNLCDKHGVLLIFDEIQTGMNRTGRWWAGGHWSVTPDIMTVSKALGNGFPISAFITRDDIAASYTRPGASTYGGNPVSAAAALAVIEYHKRHEIGANAARAGRDLMFHLTSLSETTDALGTPRGRGLMIGVPVIDADGEPDAVRCDALLESLKDHGVFAGKTGAERNVVTFMPPLTITEAQTGEICNALESALS